MHSIKQVDGAPPNGRRVGPRLESRRRRNRFKPRALEMPHRAPQVRGRRHPEEALAVREYRPHRVGLLRGVDRGVQHHDPRGIHAQRLRRLRVAQRHRQARRIPAGAAHPQARLREGLEEAAGVPPPGPGEPLTWPLAPSRTGVARDRPQADRMASRGQEMARGS